MALSPALFTALVSDGFRAPAPAAALTAGFQAGDLVVIGADLVGQAANDSDWDNAPSARASSLNLVGVITVPKGAAEVIPIGAKIAINVTANGVATTGNVATAVAVGGTNGPTTGTNYPLGISLAAAGAGTTTVTVLMWPGSGLGS
jgi:predicted RecA/RadA family phage recombinase